MEWLIAVIVVAVLGAAAVAAAGGLGAMPAEPVYDTFRQDLPTDRPLQPADLQALRFGVTLRGYSMPQVDELLDRLTRELAVREAGTSAADTAEHTEPAERSEHASTVGELR